MKKNLLIVFGIFMLASTTPPTSAMDSDSGREEGVPQRDNHPARKRENKREKREKAKREVEGLKLRLSHLEEFKGEMISAESDKNENKRSYKVAKVLAERWGRYVGAQAGIFSGMGYTAALLSLVKKEDIAFSSVFFTGSHLLSHYFSRHDKNVYYRAILRENHAITPEQKRALKKKYHTEEFKANTVATAATAMGVTACLLYGVCYLFPHKFDGPSTKSTFWNTVPLAVMGIASLKWLTYTGTRSYKKWSRGNQ